MNKTATKYQIFSIILICFLCCYSFGEWIKTNTTGYQYVTSLVADSNVIYIGTYGNGVLKSTEFGMNWQPFNKGVMHTSVTSLAINNSIFAGTSDGGIYKYIDSSGAWKQLSISDSFSPVYSFASNKDKYFFAGGEKGVVYSTDNGEQWNKTPLTFTTYILYYNDQFLYAVTNSKGVLSK